MKRKLLCVAVALVMILPLAFAALPMSSANIELGFDQTAAWTPVATTGWGSQYVVEADNSVTMWYGVADVTWANLAITYTGALTTGSDYTIDLDFRMPSQNGGVGDGIAPDHEWFNGSIVFALGTTADGWTGLTDLVIKPVDYTAHPSVGTAGTGLTQCWEMVSNPTGAPAAVGSNTGVAYADANLQSADWNHFRAVVENGAADIYLNGVKILEDYALAGAGTCFGIGTNGDSGVASDVHAGIKNVVITNGTDTAEFFTNSGSTVTLEGWDALPNTAPYGAGSMSVNADGDIVFSAPSGGWFPSAAMTTDVRVPMDGFTITFNKPVFANGTSSGPNSYFGIFFSRQKANSTGAAGFLGARTISPQPAAAADKVFGITFTGYSGGAWGAIVTEGPAYASLKPYVDNTAGNDTTLTVSPVYKKLVGDEVHKFVKIYLNGVCIYQTYDANADKIDDDDYEPDFRNRDMEFDVTNAIRSTQSDCYISICLCGEGSDGGSVTIKDISYGADNVTAPTVLGAQYRTTGTPGLRFATKINKSKFLSLSDIDSFGTLLIPADRVDDPTQLVHTSDGTITSNVYAAAATEYLDVEAVKMYKETGDDITFTAVLVGIPDGMEDRQFVARGYVKLTDGSIIYADPIVRSINDVIAASELDALNA